MRGWTVLAGLAVMALVFSAAPVMAKEHKGKAPTTQATTQPTEKKHKDKKHHGEQADKSTDSAAK